MANGPRIEIVNWAEFQHYKQRSPPWIKLHRKLLNNRGWHAIDAHASRLLIELWMLASESSDGSVEMSTADLAWRLRREDVLDIARALLSLDKWRFIKLLRHDASTVLAGRAQAATPEGEGETEGEQRTDSDSNESGAGAPPSFPQRPAEQQPPNGNGQLSAGDLMGMVRRRLYVSGRPPTGRKEGQDFNTITTMLGRGLPAEGIAEAIEAAATMRDDGACGFASRTDSLSMGALYFKPKAQGDWTPRPFWNEAVEYLHRKQGANAKHAMSKLRIQVG